MATFAWVFSSRIAFVFGFIYGVTYEQNAVIYTYIRINKYIYKYIFLQKDTYSIDKTVKIGIWWIKPVVDIHFRSFVFYYIMGVPELS